MIQLLTKNRTRLIAAIIGVLIMVSIYKGVLFINGIIRGTFPSSLSSKLNVNTEVHVMESQVLDTSFYSLASSCTLGESNNETLQRANEFDVIYKTLRWKDGESASGPGSNLEGALDWIKHLKSLFKYFSIRSIADIPCGDTTWQFCIRDINTIEQVYFGGDISTRIIKQNQKLYGTTHKNKLFDYWDLVNCGIPTFTYKNLTHEFRSNSFDLIIVRDALQHMNIRNGLKAVRNVVTSNAKYFAVSTYPPEKASPDTVTRSIEKNETLPLIPSGCSKKNYCKVGNITEGNWYPNNINCHPFNFPLNKAILVQPSHKIFSIEYDEIHIYKIDDELKNIVKHYDDACI
ncbi:hypothetical protein I4U23_022348 [Adineta vaga]|nr:hypothetical protein I4U23_022348 [Adineta vaga]